MTSNPNITTAPNPNDWNVSVRWPTSPYPPQPHQTSAQRSYRIAHTLVLTAWHIVIERCQKINGTHMQQRCASDTNCLKILHTHYRYSIIYYIHIPVKQRKGKHWHKTHVSIFRCSLTRKPLTGARQQSWMHVALDGQLLVIRPLLGGWAPT